MKNFYFDLETTGLHYWKHGIHQLSAILEIDDKIVAKTDLKIQPYKKAIIEDEALSVSNVKKSDLSKYIPFEQGYKDLVELLGKYCDKYDKTDKFHLIGYNNASFDNAFLRAFFVQNNDKYFNSWFWIDTIDVMVLASNALKKERHTMPDFKLGTVARALGIKVNDENLHDSMYDIELTHKLYKQL